MDNVGRRYSSTECVYAALQYESIGVFDLVGEIDEERKDSLVFGRTALRKGPTTSALYDTPTLAGWMNSGNTTHPETRANITHLQHYVNRRLHILENVFPDLCVGDATLEFRASIVHAFLNNSESKKGERAAAFMDLETLEEICVIHVDLAFADCPALLTESGQWLLRVSSMHNAEDLPWNSTVFVIAYNCPIRNKIVQARCLYVHAYGVVALSGGIIPKEISEETRFDRHFPCLFDLIASFGLKFEKLVRPL